MSFCGATDTPVLDSGDVQSYFCLAETYMCYMCPEIISGVIPADLSVANIAAILLPCEQA